VIRAKVYVTPRKGVLDPQGKAVAQSLRSLGYEEVREVRLGKFIELSLVAVDGKEAFSRVTEMCQRLLANQLIEDFRVEIDTEELG